MWRNRSAWGGSQGTGATGGMPMPNNSGMMQPMGAGTPTSYNNGSIQPNGSMSAVAKRF